MIRIAIALAVLVASHPAHAVTVDSTLAPLLARMINPVIVQVQSQPVSASPDQCLRNLNIRRAYNGLRPLEYDATLTRMARQEAYECGSRGLKDHYRGAYGEGRYAGVGWRISTRDATGDQFNSCYAGDPSKTRAGVAAYVGPNGTTYAGYFQ